jgi:hypothetical protein
MGIVFEGQPPYALPPAQSATARDVDDVVEVTLRVAIAGKQPSPAPIRIQMTSQVARALAAQLQSAATAAEQQAAEKS